MVVYNHLKYEFNSNNSSSRSPAEGMKNFYYSIEYFIGYSSMVLYIRSTPCFLTFNVYSEISQYHDTNRVALFHSLVIRFAYTLTSDARTKIRWENIPPMLNPVPLY